MPEELPENRFQRLPPAKFIANDWLPNGKRRKAVFGGPTALSPPHIPSAEQKGRVPEASDRAIAGAAASGRPPRPPVQDPEPIRRIDCEVPRFVGYWTQAAVGEAGKVRVMIENGEKIEAPTHARIASVAKGGRQPVQKPDPEWVPPARAKPVSLYAAPVYNTQWPTPEFLARLIVAACKVTGESPLEIFSGKGITTNVARYFIGNLLREKLNLSAPAAGRVLGIKTKASSSAMFAPSFAKAPHEKVRVAVTEALAAVVADFEA